MMELWEMLKAGAMQSGGSTKGNFALVDSTLIEADEEGKTSHIWNNEILQNAKDIIVHIEVPADKSVTFDNVKFSGKSGDSEITSKTLTSLTPISSVYKRFFTFRLWVDGGKLFSSFAQSASYVYLSNGTHNTSAASIGYYDLDTITALDLSMKLDAGTVIKIWRR